MISDINMKRYFGKNIAIYPFNPVHIEGASIDFCASEYAWSLQTKKRIQPVQDEHGKKHIPILGGDTAIIFTQEAISLDKNFAGTCHARLKLSCSGLMAMNSPIKPEYTGRLSIPIYNNTEQQQYIKCGDPVVVVMLHRLGSPAVKDDGNGHTNRIDILMNSVRIPAEEIDNEVRNEINGERREYCSKDEVLKAMKESRDYQEWKKSHISGFLIRRVLLWAICIGVTIAMLILQRNVSSETMSTICIIYGAIIAPLWAIAIGISKQE